MERLDKGIAYVVFEFSDTSRYCIRTSRNKEELSKVGAVFIKGYLYDFDRGIYYKIRQDAVKVFISEELPEARNEVEQFVRRFKS